MRNDLSYHKPVLLKESVDGLNIRPDGIYVDLTFGGGGHSREILNRLGEKGRLLAFDQDPDAEKNLIDDSRFTFIMANFRYLRNFLRYYEINKVAGILGDLGISSHQIDLEERGFTYLGRAGLDMRMNSVDGQTAADVLNLYPPEKLNGVFANFGEVQRYKNLTKIIVKRREEKAFHATEDFVSAIESFLPAFKRNKLLSQIFQALRIEVNDEMGALDELLLQIPDYLDSKGRLVIISYHSIEDRRVKNMMKAGNLEGQMVKDFFGNVSTPFRMVNKSIISPSEEEISENSRARSAKLRIAEKK